MKSTVFLSEDDLTRMEAAAARLSAASSRAALDALAVRTLEADGGPIHLLGSGEAVDAWLRGIEEARSTVPRLAAAVRALKAELEARPAAPPAPPPAAPAAARAASRSRSPQPPLEEVPAALVAPFRPGPRSLEAARSEPLTALAVQVAKALAPDAGELDRARLIAMAFAVTRGDMDAFWAARTQRGKKAATRAPKASLARPKRRG